MNDTERLAGLKKAADARVAQYDAAAAAWDQDPAAPEAKGRRPDSTHCLIAVDPFDVTWLAGQTKPTSDADKQKVSDLRQGSANAGRSPEVHIQAHDLQLLVSLVGSPASVDSTVPAVDAEAHE